MAINKTIAMKWKGVEYNIKMTMRLIDRIEEERSLNLMNMVVQLQDEDLRYSHASHFISLILNSEGANVTQEEVFQGMFNGEGFTPLELKTLLWSIFGTIFPEPKKKSSPTKKSKK